MTSVRSPREAAIAARLQVIVDLPTPPFWLKTTRRMASPEAVQSRIVHRSKGFVRSGRLAPLGLSAAALG